MTGKHYGGKYFWYVYEQSILISSLYILSSFIMKMTYEELNNKDVTDQATNMVQLLVIFVIPRQGGDIGR